MMSQSVTLESVKPVFIKDKDIGDDTITAINICNAVTRVVGTSKLEGVQKIGNIWRVYLKDMSTRLELTVKEQIVINGKAVPVYDQNPNHITFKGLSRQNHWTKTYIPTTLGIHWVCVGNVLNPAN